MSYPTERSVPVKIWYGGKVQNGWHVGIGAVGDGQKVFGLCEWSVPEYVSHMAYGLDYFVPDTVLQYARTVGNGWFWFDAGTTRTEIKISADELERAFRALGLIEDPKPTAEDPDALMQELHVALSRELVAENDALQSGVEDLAYLMNELHDARTELAQRRGQERNLRDIAATWADGVVNDALSGAYARQVLRVLDSDGSVTVLSGEQELACYEAICQIMERHAWGEITDAHAISMIAEQTGE